MVSSETGEGVLVDCSVGSIVWVRRRNGSWWPGRILGPEDLSSSVITSPRSGTPVKLLGREDASVDWYNLEKSKRVKSFRCGEFDDCIERAEAAQGMPPKKREKYARREDAILHALELERQILEKKYGKLEYSSNGKCKKSPDAITSLENMGNGGGNSKKSRSDQVLEKFGSSLAEKHVSDHLMYLETVREGNQLSGDDDSPGVLPRMRGLQDFGLRTAPPPREELSGVAFRAKRSRYAYLPYDSGDSSNENRIRPSPMEIPVSKFEDNVSGSTEDTETDCSETDSLDSDSDNDMAALSDGSACIELRPKYPRRIVARDDHGSISSIDDYDETAFADDSSHPYPHDFASPNTGVSKWQLKGKRNNRNLRSQERPDAEVSRRYTNVRNSNWSSSGFKADYGDRANIPRYGSKGLHSSNHNIIDSEGSTWKNWEDPQEYVDRQHSGSRFMLMDVDLKVQANNYRRDVPMISLTSKLNGHAIVGHPIQVEVLETGSSANLLPATDYFYPESLESPTALSPVWRTGRRTANSRFRRPRPPSIIDGDNKQFEKRLPFGTEHGSFGPKPIQTKMSHPSSNQKIRSLSSIASEQKLHIDHGSGSHNYQVEGLIKTEKAPTTVACIPVKLVFSRLHEELAGRRQ